MYFLKRRLAVPESEFGPDGTLVIDLGTLKIKIGPTSGQQGGGTLPCTAGPWSQQQRYPYGGVSPMLPQMVSVEGVPVPPQHTHPPYGAYPGWHAHSAPNQGGGSLDDLAEAATLSTNSSSGAEGPSLPRHNESPTPSPPPPPPPHMGGAQPKSSMPHKPSNASAAPDRLVVRLPRVEGKKKAAKTSVTGTTRSSGKKGASHASSAESDRLKSHADIETRHRRKNQSQEKRIVALATYYAKSQGLQNVKYNKQGLLSKADAMCVIANYLEGNPAFSSAEQFFQLNTNTMS